MIVFSGKPVLHLQKTTVQFRGPTQSLASGISAGQLYSTQAAEDKEEESLHSIISNTEAVRGKPGDHAICNPWLLPTALAPSGGHPRSCQLKGNADPTDVGQEGHLQARGCTSDF
jgi:hypothetical protein